MAHRKQWEAIHDKSQHVARQPLLTLIDRNSVMVAGVDSADIPKELPETVEAREREAVALAEWALDDVWVHLHREHRDDSVSGFTFPALQRRIDRVHVSSELLSFVRDVYMVCISSNHMAVVVQTGRYEERGVPPRYPFPVNMLFCKQESSKKKSLPCLSWRACSRPSPLKTLLLMLRQT